LSDNRANRTTEKHGLEAEETLSDPAPGGIFRPLRHAPAYRALSTEIERMILSGQLKPGDALPTETALAERFGGRQVTRESFAAMVAEVAGLLARFSERERLGALARGAGFHLLGTSGTVTTLAGVHLGLERYDRRRVDGLWMSGHEVDAMIERLLSWEFHERVANPCIGADRADLVLAGCAILEAIRRAWPSQRLRVADRGLREGILSELMADDGVWSRARGRNWLERRR